MFRLQRLGVPDRIMEQGATSTIEGLTSRVSLTSSRPMTASDDPEAAEALAKHGPGALRRLLSRVQGNQVISHAATTASPPIDDPFS